MVNGPDRNCGCRRLGGQNLHPFKRPIGFFATDLTIIQESMKRKFVRGPENRPVTTEEPYFPVGQDIFQPSPSTAVIRIPLSASTDIYTGGLMTSGSVTNIGTFQSANGIEGGNSYRVNANDQGLFMRNPLKFMPMDYGEFSVYLNGHDAGGSGTNNYIFSVNENLVFRWESGTQELRLYPDLTNYPSDYLGMPWTSAQWYSVPATWHKYKIKWDYPEQNWSISIDETNYGQRIGSSTIPFPGWDALSYLSIFADNNNANNVYHDCAFIASGPPEFDPVAMDRFESMFEPTGFVNGTGSTIIWSDSSPDRTLTIQLDSTSFSYYIGSVKYTKFSNESIQITDTDGYWVIYYDGSTLTSLHDPTHAQIKDVIQNKAWVGGVYWNSTLIEGKMYDERHRINMDSDTHVYLHETNGMAYDNGLALGDILADDTGADDEDAQFSNTSGQVFDEDLEVNINTVGKLVGLEIWYIDTGVWYWDTNAGFSVIDDGIGARLAYNDGTTPLVEVDNNKFVLCHVFATNLTDGKLIALVGQNQYISKVAAQNAAETEINTLVLGDLPTPEMLPIATVIFQTSTAYGNSVKARIISTAEGDDYIDWRKSKLSPGAGDNVASVLISQAGGTGGTYATLTGTIDGINDTFTTPSVIDPTKFVVVLNGRWLLPDGDDYTVIASNQIQFANPPPTNSAILTIQF